MAREEMQPLPFGDAIRIAFVLSIAPKQRKIGTFFSKAYSPVGDRFWQLKAL